MRTPRFRLARMALSTLLGGRRLGYFIPDRHADAAAANGGGYPALTPLFEAARPAMTELIEYFGAIREDIEKIGENDPPQPRWDQTWFPRLDALAAYALVRREAPARIVEVGSGHSTRFLARAVRDGGFATEHTAIDPQPRAVIAGLPVTYLRARVQEAPAEPFAALAAGDMLVIDSSHVLMPGTDVDHLFNRVLPTLPAGVLIHVHDVFLPDAYPERWTWRGYNEQLAVAALLQGGGYEILFASHFAATRLAAEVASSPAGALPLVGDAVEASLWLRKSAPVVPGHAG